jgi:hypothetical protein
MKRPNTVFCFYDIEAAFGIGNSDDRSNEVYLDRHTGNTLFFLPLGDSDDVPDDLDDTSRYVAIPDTRPLGLGSQLAIDFASEIAPELLDQVRYAFHKRGGFRRFKDLLYQSDLLDAWHKYAGEKEHSVIVKWCADNDIRYTTPSSPAN